MQEKIGDEDMKNVKVMLATATKEIDEPIKKIDGIEVVEEVFYREGILLVLNKISQKSQEALPEVIVISESLEGRLSIEELIKEIRGFNCRIVYLPGMIAEMSEFINNATSLGVVNIMYDPIEIPKLAQLIKSPPAQTNDMREWRSRENMTLEEEPISRKSIDEHILYTDSTEINPTIVPRLRTGPLTVLLGIGESRIEDWIKKNYEGRLTVLGASIEKEEFKKQVEDLNPDIVILMRQTVLGGLTDADHLAVWSANRVSAVLFIVGELDNVGLGMVNNVKKAGIHRIISCEKGGQLAGDDLNYAIETAIRELHTFQETSEETRESVTLTHETKKAIDNLIKGSLNAIKTATSIKDTPKEKAPKRISKPKINRHEGISIDEQPEGQIYSTQVLKNPMSIVPGGILAVVSPWKPNLAGRIAAQAVKMFKEVEGGEVVYIGASARSTGALWLDIADEELMMADWRVPGSISPLIVDNLKVYAVDPAKDLRPNVEGELFNLLREVRKTASYTVMDLGEDVAMAQKVSHQGWTVILVIVPGNDPVEQKLSSLWLKQLMDGKQNIVVGIDLRGVPASIPEGLKPKVVIRNNPADALAMALRKVGDDEFHWN